MALLTRDEILRAKDITTERMDVPEWGGEVIVIGLTGRERDDFEASITRKKGKKTDVNYTNMRARLVSLSLVDEEGRRMFSPEDISTLGQKSAAALDRIFDVARRLSGLSTEDVADLEEAEGNSETTTSEDSPSD